MVRDNPQNEEMGRDLDLTRLERQMERGSLFTHTIVSQNADRIHEAESFLYGIVDVLIGKRMLTEDEVLQGAARVRQEMEEKGQTIGPGIALRIEGNGTKKDDFVPVDCSKRLHICKAVCCRLHFALTAEEVESGKIKWDLGEPYHIRQEATGYCHHLDPSNRCCSIYADRPGICRQYSCANDERIWKDFENMELNHEWLEENLNGSSRPTMVRALMHNVEFEPGDEISESSETERKELSADKL